jgi:hypothetical protein
MPANTKVRVRDVLNPKVPRPPKGDPRRDDYDAAMRVVIHLTMIFSGILAAGVMTWVGISVYAMIAVQGVLPGAVQEVGDFLLRL